LTQIPIDSLGARYYSPQLGRFLTPDWSPTPEPVPYANLANPQSLNLYSYVLNNPVSATDPDGHWCLFGWGTTCTKPAPKKLPVKEGGPSDPTGLDDLSRSMLATANREARWAKDLANYASAHPGMVLAANLGLALASDGGSAASGVIEREVTAVLERAATATGNETIEVSSREVAEQAAEKFVGNDAKELTQGYGSRAGQAIGQRSADGARIVRDDGDHLNFQNLRTGGNLHVKIGVGN